MKSLPEITLNNKRGVLFTVALLLFVGLIFIFRLPEGVFPRATFPRILVTVQRGYAPLEEMAVGVTRPLEEAMSTIEGIRMVRSNTSRGYAEIDLFFDWNIDLFRAYQLVEAKISEARSLLPADIEVSVRRMTTSAYPMSGYSLYSDKRNLRELRDIAKFAIRPQLSGLKGVYRIEIVGGYRPEYWVILKPEKLGAYHLSPDDVEQVLKRFNQVEFLGRIDEEYRLHLGFGDNRLRTREEIEGVVVVIREKVPIYIRDVARVEPAFKEEYLLTTSNWHPAVLFNILKHPEANGVEVSRLVDRKLRELKRMLPADVQIAKWYDLSDFVRRSLRGVVESIILGSLIISLPIFLFLGKLRITLITILVIPSAVILSFIVMGILRLSLNVMTLGGLAASIGILVDNAIVVVENSVRHFREGEPREQAVIKATTEIFPPMIGATLTTLVVFIPLVFLSEVTGIFFRAMALTMASVIGVSLFLAVFFTPVLTAWALKARGSEKLKGLPLRGLLSLYESALRISLRRHKLLILLMLFLIAGTVLIYHRLKTGFLPKWDEGTIVLDYKAPAGTSLEETDRMMLQIEKILKGIPEVRAYSRRTGYGLAHPHPAHEGDFLITLKEKRQRSVFQIMDELRTRVSERIPNLDKDLFQVLPDRLGDLTGKQAPIVVKVFGNNLPVIRKKAEEIAASLRKVKGTADVRVKISRTGPQFDINVDPAKAALLGLAPEDIFRYVKIGLWGEVATKIKQGLRLVNVRVKYPRDYNSHIEKLHDLPIFSRSRGLVPLNTVARMGVNEGEADVAHENMSQVVPVTAQISGRDLGGVIRDVKEVLRKTRMPYGVTLSLGGYYESQMKSFRELLLALILASFLVFNLLLFEFASFKNAIAIFLGTLLSLSGVFLGLWITRTPLDVSSFTGMITVIGIVVNNGILLIDFAEKYRRGGMALKEALFKAGRVRLRPILITNLSTLAGFLPLALKVSVGVEILQPFAIAVISGLCGSLFFSLLVIPTLYYLFAKKLDIKLEI